MMRDERSAAGSYGDRTGHRADGGGQRPGLRIDDGGVGGQRARLPRAWRQLTVPGVFPTLLIALLALMGCGDSPVEPDSSVPPNTPSFLMTGATQAVSSGKSHTCAIWADGSVACWGDNTFGQATVPAGLGTVSQVSAGGLHTCAVKSDGSVACWGTSGNGQATVPAGLGTATQVSTGEWHTCAVKTDGSIACWGFNIIGQTTVPAGLGTVSQVSAGDVHSCALKSDGGVACWGYNGVGQTNVPAALGSARQVSAGGTHTCAVKTDGSVACWGWNGKGQTTVPAGLGTASQVSAGTEHTCAIGADGSVACWGYNGSGQATVPAGLGTVSQVSAGRLHTCALKLDQTIECWGNPASFMPPSGPGVTPVGSDITVSPIDQTTGDPAPVELTFGNVTGGGETSVTSSTVGQGGPPSPSGFRLGSPPTYYDVQTTATFTGSVELCFDYSGASYGNENKLKLLHYENGVWTDVTTSLDTTNDIICGTVTSLSPFLVAEENVAPLVTAVTLPAAPVPLGTSASVTASFTDGNPGDTHTAVIGWDDGTTSSANVSEAAGAGTASAAHVYTSPGVYTVIATVSDGDLQGLRSSSDDQPAYIVVYDPTAGFVTGGGWFYSPAGACLWSGCAADGSTVGKASFGFVSRYKKGASTPSGNTEFQFKAGGLGFNSTSYQWLVVAGSRAQYKGEGTINGSAGTYGFLITAIDGALAGGGGVDRFRIKIWDVGTGAIVYDNQMGGAEDTDAATALGGGSIVIHK